MHTAENITFIKIPIWLNEVGHYGINYPKEESYVYVPSNIKLTELHYKDFIYNKLKAFSCNILGTENAIIWLDINDIKIKEII